MKYLKKNCWTQLILWGFLINNKIRLHYNVNKVKNLNKLKNGLRAAIKYLNLINLLQWTNYIRKPSGAKTWDFYQLKCWVKFFISFLFSISLCIFYLFLSFCLRYVSWEWMPIIVLQLLLNIFYIIILIFLFLCFWIQQVLILIKVKIALVFCF